MTPSDASPDPPDDYLEDKELTNTVSWRALQTAKVVGILPLLKHAVSDSQRDYDTVQLLSFRVQLLGRLMLAGSEVDSIAAQAGCEEERAHQLADRLQKAQGARIRQQTLIAVVIGGLTNIVTGALGLALAASTAVNIAAVSGGVLGGSFGVAALYDDPRQEYDTPANLLRELWDGPQDSALFPQSVWKFLNGPMKAESGSRTFREELIAGWRQEGRLGGPGTKEAEDRTTLMLNEGGLYSVHDLIVRAQMLDMLEATIHLMHQDLEQLIRTVMMPGIDSGLTAPR
ncbi:MAG: hypothetical protein ACT4OO_11830 [Nitrospiraceae bacterium]